MPRGTNRMIARGNYHAPICQWDEPHPETGKTWQDMPGSTPLDRKMNFFFYRRGVLVENIEGIRTFGRTAAIY